jgi:thioredoxin-like negative regulator of GroEL
MTKTNDNTVDALLVISTRCPHCSSVLAHLSRLIKLGEIAQLTVINIDQQPLVAQKYGIRSVPWLKIGKQHLQGLQTLETIKQNIIWAKEKQSLSADFDFLLSDGQVDKVIESLQQNPSAISAILTLLNDEGTVLSTRIGIGVVMEDFAASALLQSIVPQFGTLSQHKNAILRSDACYYLGLSGDVLARPFLEVCLKDSSPDVREIAQDGLEALSTINN